MEQKKKRTREASEPTVAPGLEDDELHRDATEEEVRQGDYTMVTRLSWDENENGSFNEEPENEQPR
ncbi:MAG TPA: hypothetical protein VFV52_15295 [Bacilli bacterium]|nr:hypothetical protein [Bacilli bacterium]